MCENQYGAESKDGMRDMRGERKTAALDCTAEEDRKGEYKKRVDMGDGVTCCRQGSRKSLEIRPFCVRFVMSLLLNPVPG